MRTSKTSPTPFCRTTGTPHGLSVATLLIIGTIMTLPPPTSSAQAGELSPIETAARFQVDRAGYLKQYETVFLRPIRKGYDAVAVGNGDLAAIVWQPGDLTWMLNKCDLSGQASQAARLTFETPIKIADRLGRLETRLSLADATVSVKYTGGEFGDSKGWGWRGSSGGAPDPKDTDLGALDVSAYVPHGRNVLLIEYTEKPKVPHPTTIGFERWVQSGWGDNVQAQVNGQTLAITYQLQDGPHYAAVLAFDGFGGATVAKTGPMKAALTLPAAAETRGRIAVAVVTSHEASDPLAAATKLAQDTLAANAAQLRAAHRAAWSSFWNRFFVDAGHPYLNALYHVALYELGITSRGRRPVKFNGALNLWNERDRAWGAPYWCHNQTEVYLPVYTANQIELAENFHEWIAAVRPAAVNAARKSFGIGGAYYPEVMAHEFTVTEPEKTEKPPLANEMAYVLSSGTRYALMMWNRYLYTLDREFLAAKAYPVIRDVAEFYVNYGQLGPDGLYHVGPALSWEERPLGQDAHADCAAWRAIFSVAMEAAGILAVDKERLPVWQERFEKAPPYPIHDGAFSVVRRKDGTSEPTTHFQWQLPNLSGVFPYSVIGLRAPQPLRQTAEATFARYRFNADAGHEFLPVIAARLGNPDWVRAALFQYIQFFQNYDQGLLNYYNIHGNKDAAPPNQEELHPYLEASGILATAVNEIL
ncbi:MAG: hypothetical protein HY646_15135, partial [Acidobacteria bacterium]|nr:hypothetical protein [Acidobacteriota bacterium]